MNRRVLLSISACLACPAWFAASARAQPSAPDQSPAELAAQLRQMKSGLDKNPPTLPAAVPDHWRVVTSDGHYSIASQPLQAQLDEDHIPAARQWLDRMARELEAYSATPEESPAAARASLTKILARREFSHVHPPSAWDLFRERVAAWIASLLQRILGAAGQHIGAGQVLFWILIVAAIGLIAMWLVRLWRRTDPLLALPRVLPSLASRDSVAWLGEARQAAARSQWREAIHAVYWAGIARLQENRALSEDRTRTPREYLRLIPTGQPARSPLGALTVSLERFWYAKQAAGMADFDESLKHLEALGCRLD